MITVKEGLTLGCNSTIGFGSIKCFSCTVIDKSLGDTFAFLGRLPVHTGPTLSLTPQKMLDVCPEFFSSFNFVKGGGRENCKKIPKRMYCLMSEPRNDRKI